MKNIKKRVTKIAVYIVIGILIALGVYKLNDFEKTQLVSYKGRTFENAIVTEIIQDNLQEDGNRYGEQKVKLKITTGDLKDKTVEATSSSGNLFGVACKIGMRVVSIVSVSGDTVTATVYNRDRVLQIVCFILLFVGVMWLVGGKKGLKASLTLAVSVCSIIWILFPLIYRGFSPFASAVLVCIFITLLTIFFVGGINRKTIAALLGTTCGVILAGISAKTFGVVSGISGWNVSDIESLLFLAGETDIKVGELLFVGILISSLGAVMDVGVEISASIAEIHAKRPELSAKSLFKSGITIGKDTMGTMSNTLILAFVGSGITTLIIDYSYDLSARQLINSYSIGIEIMQGLSGSIGVILAVPITSFFSAMLLTRKKSE